jgi:hypothetical protein
MSNISETLKACMYLLESYNGKPLQGNTKGKHRNHAGVQRKQRIATAEEVKKMKAMRRAGKTLRQIATALDVSEYQVSVRTEKPKS